MQCTTAAVAAPYEYEYCCVRLHVKITTTVRVSYKCSGCDGGRGTVRILLV
jgi:hypothetical protein